ncbi:multidrug ABC transporter substrate-binding protein [Massilia sp. WF1]|uniref:ABC transporter permease n=1 Tax=unclassified Massilia TaxID=2609279 RepID=UPI00064A159B|nr:MULTISPECIES: ABC transporter permease [unclassified Massilia]ALK97151.1 multidrug ABC transporter substrate-binding protein [Massilia sp. WG5]KLU35881.1 multidrug ABC transporter substrate-binding protein [Massilia sp. WF1]
MSGLGLLSRWLLFGEWRAHPMRALLAVLAIAVGVAMGFAIHLINAAAFNEFSAAIQSLAGQADLQVGGREAQFDQGIYPRLATHQGVAIASPVLEVNAALAGRPGALHIVGLDALRAGYVTPDLAGVPEPGRGADLLADDTIFLSPAAQSWLGLRTGDTLHLRAGTADVALRVAGPILRARSGQRLAVMDIGALQWRFRQLGKLSRVDLKLREGVDRAAFERSLAAELESSFPGRFTVAAPNDAQQESRNNNLSRAYRVNLTVLALVALFTGAFLVFSTQALSVLRRRSQFALLRVLGLPRRLLLRQVLIEGASLGVIGSLAGIGAGYALAAAALAFFGGDLGAGYFSGVKPAVHFTPLAACVFFLLGLGVALLGCAAPAWEAARARPAVALKSGNDETALERLSRIWPSLLCLGAAAACAFAPPVFELPLFGYIAVALLLIGGIGLMPRLAASAFRLLNRVQMRRQATHSSPAPSPVLSLALARLANAPGQASIALGGVLASFSLMVAMGIMVASFRVSVDDWMLHILPADLYVRTANGGNTGGLGPAEQAAIAGLPGAAQAAFLRTRPLTLDPARPAINLIARDLDAADPGRMLALVGAPAAAPAGELPVWVSEAMTDLYGFHTGQRITLPLGGRRQRFFVAGVWRDYANQTGSVVVRLADYRRLTGDGTVTDAALWAAKGSSADALAARLRALPFGAILQLASPGEIRAASLKIFDRSFAVTYLLEAIAIAIGLSGVAATFSAQTLARAREFGMLRHVGVSRGQVLKILALEGGALTVLGVATGFALGLLISLILVFVVNPQSFHWTMQLHLPWPLLGSVAAVLVLAAVATALVSGRYALSGGPVRAVREDW